MGGLLAAAVIAARWWRDEETRAAFPWHLLLPVALAYFILGEFFSFVMLVKPVRALLMMLPLIWIVVGWMLEKRRVPAELFLLVALTYASLAFAQKGFNLFNTRDHLVEDTYQLTASSWLELPSAWHRGETLNQQICDTVCADLPAQGVICVNALELRNALRWRVSRDELLRGETPRREVRALFNFKGEYFDRALVGADRVALVTFLPVQSSRQAWMNSMGMEDYARANWIAPSNPSGAERSLPSVRDEAVGSLFMLGVPLSPEAVDQADAAPPFAGMARVRLNRETGLIEGRQFTREEAWGILKSWIDKRLD